MKNNMAAAPNRKTINNLIKGIEYFILIITVMLILFPVVYAIFGSFKSREEFLRGGLSMLPEKWIFQNYLDAFKLAKFGIYTWNSVFFSVFSVIGVLVICSMVGYLLSRKNFWGKKLLLGSFASSLFLTGAVTIYPVFMLCKNLGLINSLAGMVIVQVAWEQALYAVLIMGYCEDVPKSIDESATIDGCGVFRIYWNIILPVIKPILATVALLEFRAAWNSYMLPLAFTLGNFNLRTLAVGVVAMRDTGEGISAWNLMIAGSVISLVPILILYILLNKFFISGLTQGAVKE